MPLFEQDGLRICSRFPPLYPAVNVSASRLRRLSPLISRYCSPTSLFSALDEFAVPLAVAGPVDLRAGSSCHPQWASIEASSRCYLFGPHLIIATTPKRVAAIAQKLEPPGRRALSAMPSSCRRSACKSSSRDARRRPPLTDSERTCGRSRGRPSGP